MKEKQNISVHLQIDNTTALSYLKKMGGYQQCSDDRHHQTNLVAPTQEGYIPHSRVHSLGIEHTGELRVQKLEEFQRMELETLGFQEHLQITGICLSTQGRKYIL